MGGRSFSSNGTYSSSDSDWDFEVKDDGRPRIRPKPLKPYFNERHKSDFSRRTAYRRKARRIMREIAFVYRTDAPFRTAAWGLAAFIGLKLFEWWIK